MAALVHFDAQGRWGETLVGEAAVGAALRGLGLEFGRWPRRVLGDGSVEAVLAAYADELSALKARLSIVSVDRVTLRPDHPGWPDLRRKFTAEHTHADAEIRFFLGGSGLFYVRLENGYAGLLCEAGEWVLVPAGLRHFFDAGEHPDFDALRLFSQADGWQAEFTGAEAPQLPLFDAFRARLDTLS